jgi:hypothetical protein
MKESRSRVIPMVLDEKDVVIVIYEDLVYQFVRTI